MNILKINDHKQLLTLSIILASLFVNAHARPLIEDTLSKGGEWSLTIDGIQDNLKLIQKPKIRHKPKGTKFLSHVLWGKIKEPFMPIVMQIIKAIQ